MAAQAAIYGSKIWDKDTDSTDEISLCSGQIHEGESKNFPDWISNKI
jgi:hypothetical protein